MVLPACAPAPDVPEKTGASRGGIVVGGIDRGAIGGIGRAPVVESESLVDRAFFVRALGSRCLDFGGEGGWRVGAPVFIYSCNGSEAQRVRVKEIDAASHDVELHTPLRAGGPDFCIGVRGGSVAVGAALELQACGPSDARFPWQRFALDGDSIMIGTQGVGSRVSRDFVIEPEGDDTRNTTPLVVGERDTSDAEYFRFRAVDGSGAFPTTGFVRIGPSTVPGTRSDHWLEWASNRGWGTVIEIDETRDFVITATRNIREGVTLRGYRKQRNPGPTIKFDGSDPTAIWVIGDRARVTGLRFDGPPQSAGAIRVWANEANWHVLIDHVEITHWGQSAIDIVGNDPGHNVECEPPTEARREYAYPRALNNRVLRSYIHDNRRSGGYGIAVGYGAIVLAQGNVAFKNRHSVTSDPLRHSSYYAYDNILDDDQIESRWQTNQNFDVHGTEGSGPDGSYDGGNAGEFFDIGWNTFLGHRHWALNLRGNPCGFLLFHHNIVPQPIEDAIRNNSGQPIQGYAPTTAPPLRQVFFYDNRFDQPAPMGNIGFGDFDGDGRYDVFVGTGVTWWFSSGNFTEWRLLNRMPESASELQFHDVDGDGITDVVATRNGDTVVSWAGRTRWQPTGFTGVGPRPPGRR